MFGLLSKIVNDLMLCIHKKAPPKSDPNLMLRIIQNNKNTSICSMHHVSYCEVKYCLTDERKYICSSQPFYNPFLNMQCGVKPKPEILFK
jgi:hypothetical protein